jgi:ParB/RepB/Spo0J family partition protein
VSTDIDTLPNHDLWPLTGARMASVDKISPGKYQPRKRFAPVPLAELTESIKRHGIMQPLVVRIMPGERFELVAGERRWRAAKLANLEFVPIIARELTLMEVLELQAIENTQREDLHPLEEADSYELLVNPPEGAEGLSVEAVADRVSKSISHVRKRLSLVRLIPDARDAFFADHLTLQTAYELARLPVHVQARVFPKVMATRTEATQQVRHQDAAKLLAETLGLRLNAAPFPIKDATLIPAAGGCNHCPKRTGANPDLFADVPDNDTCTDPDCHASKAAAHNERQKVKARAEGMQVIEGEEARALLKFGQSSDALGADYVYMDQPLEDLTGSKSSLAKLLGTNLKPSALFEHPLQKTLREIVTTQKAIDTLQEHSLLLAKPDKQIKAAPAPSPAPAPSMASAKDEGRWPFNVPESSGPGTGPKASTPTVPEEAWEKERQWRRALFSMVHKNMHDKGHSPVRPALQAAAVELGLTFLDDADNWAQMCSLWDWEAAVDYAEHHALHQRLIDITEHMDSDQLQLLIAELALLASIEPNRAELVDPRGACPDNSLDRLPLIETYNAQVQEDEDLGAEPPFEHPSWEDVRDSVMFPEGNPKAADTRSTPPRNAPAQRGRNSAQAKGADADASTPENTSQGPSAQTRNEKNDLAHHWVGQMVKVKGTKRFGEITEISENGDLEVAFSSGQAGTRNLHVHASNELEVLPNQTPPSDTEAEAAKPVATRAKAPVKYRNPETGETWSGRGLMPKWLKLKVDAGHSQDQYLVGGA